MRSRISALVATMALLVSLSVGTVLAAPTTSAATQSKVYHDMSHPMRANYPCAGMAHSGVAKVGQEPHFDCSTKSSGSVQPYANNESGNCSGGTTYLQKFTNVPGYSSTTQVGTFWGNNPAQSSYTADVSLPGSYAGYTWHVWDNTNVPQVMVQYFWCPASNSTLYPNGINYAYGIMQYGSGCGPIWVHDSVQLNPGGSNPDHNVYYIGDGEDKPYSSICAGNLVWDYTNLGDGTYTWWAYTGLIPNPPTPPAGVGPIVYVQTPKAQ